MRVRCEAVLVVLGAAWVLAVPQVQAQDTRVSGGVSFRLTSGTFGGEQTTSILYAPAIVRLDAGRVELVAFFPYLSVENAAGALYDGGWIPMQGAVNGAPNVGVPVGGMGGGHMGGGMMGGGTSQPSGTPLPPSTGVAVASVSGFGDIVGSAGYRLVDNLLTGMQLVVAARIKFPTASAPRGLGTGRTDVGAAATVRKRFGSGWLYGEVGYLVLGEPAGTDLRNALTWAAGGGRRLASRVFLLASAFGNTAVLPGYDSPAEVGAGIGVRLAESLYFTAIPSVGLSHASPSYGVTFGVSTDLWRR